MDERETLEYAEAAESRAASYLSALKECVEALERIAHLNIEQIRQRDLDELRPVIARAREVMPK